MTPEQKSRQEIDRQLGQCGWVVQSYRDINISAGLGLTVREFPLKSGHADYLLYADCKALGVTDTIPQGHTLTGDETQSGKYLNGPDSGLRSFRLPLTFTQEWATKPSPRKRDRLIVSRLPTRSVNAGIRALAMSRTFVPRSEAMLPS
jgi:hypothetical protein